MRHIGRKGGRAVTGTVGPDWETLVTENEHKLYRAALAILGSPQEAEDAVQDAFLRYLEKAPAKLERHGAWLMRVLVNGCKSRLRLKWRQVVELPAELADLAHQEDEREELEELWQLPAEDRAVIHLFYYQGYSTDEIARMLGVMPGTVRSRLSRARQKLKTLLTDQEEGGN